MLVISDQVLLRGGNQVLYQSLKGYLRAGFNIILMIRRRAKHELDNFVSANKVFHDYKGQIIQIEFASYYEDIIENSRTLIYNFSKIARKANPVAYPSSNVILGFDGQLSRPIILSYCRYVAMWKGAYEQGKEVCRDLKPDVICGFEIGGAVPASKLGEKFNLPVFTKYMGTIAYPFIVENRKYLIWQHIKGLSVRADLYLMHDDGTKGKEVLEMLGIPEKKIRCRIDGVKDKEDEKRFTRTEYEHVYSKPLADDDFVVLSLSNHNGAYKRLDRAIRAVSQVRVGNKRVILVLVGEGKNTNSLKVLAESVGAKDRVHFLKRVPHEKIGRLFNICDAYINTNDQSNLSHPILEAIKYGTPVISMDDGSLDRIIVHGKNGLLIRPDISDPGIANAIKLLMEDKRLMNRLKQGVRESFKNRILLWDERIRLEVKDIKEILK